MGSANHWLERPVFGKHLACYYQAERCQRLDEGLSLDTLHIQKVTVSRFVRKRGQLNAKLMDEIAAAIAAIIEYK